MFAELKQWIGEKNKELKKEILGEMEIRYGRREIGGESGGDVKEDEVEVEEVQVKSSLR